MSTFWYWLGAYVLTGLLLMCGAYCHTRLIKREPSVNAMSRWENTACFLAVLMLWPLMFSILVYEGVFSRRPPAPEYREWVATPASLTRQFTKESIEQLETYRDPFNAVPAAPFGHLHDAWLRFCQQLQEDDQLWAFRIDARQDEGLDYDKRYGIVEGYALLRDGKICAEFYARMD
ncbi:hypothetical protein [Pseudomonas sp. TTU2014-080ASC]|uniref:hypothetical protein n=1 Tax=Pseudomonas sp. TTU2014-080ASC TaxID=1729724 RepID=UPI000718AB00|nr:hypothetical protein [Pseudomonas sp. TTU2014-080ASC]KRW59228.1 hypothetical protein AO726_10320 [Pseudomonas sp. TTU2014-080ASC]